MNKIIHLLLICIPLILSSTRASACGAHFMIDPDQMGFFGGAMVRMAGLAPPEPVFDIDHPRMMKSVVGAETEVAIAYSRPFFSKNVSLTITGTNNVALDQDQIILQDREGTVTVSFELTGSGYDYITLTVTGEHKGEVVREVARVYVRAIVAEQDAELQVSKRPGQTPAGY